MWFSTWLRNWKSSLERRSALKQTRRRKSLVRRVAVRPGLEALEDRTLLSPYIVTTTADSGAGSLRDAITQVNADSSRALYASPSNANVDEIDFNITAASDTGGGYNATTVVATIKPQSALPAITNPVLLDGTTEPGYAGKPIIALNGSQAGSANGLDITAGDSTIKGLVIQQFQQNGIVLESKGGDTVSGDYIGTDATGTYSIANGGNGVFLNQAAGNTIGGTTPGAGNLISGNAGNGILIQGAEANRWESRWRERGGHVAMLRRRARSRRPPPPFTRVRSVSVPTRGRNRDRCLLSLSVRSLA